jgi:hypothetical protein
MMILTLWLFTFYFFLHVHVSFAIKEKHLKFEYLQNWKDYDKNLGKREERYHKPIDDSISNLYIFFSFFFFLTH